MNIFLVADYTSMIKTIWDFALEFLNFMNPLWDWLNTPMMIGDLSFTPLVAFSGTIIFVLMALYLVKTFVPFI